MTRGVSAAVVDQKKRLEVKESLKEAYRVMKWESLLKRCWNETPSLRPTAQQILQELQQIQALHEIREEQAKQNNLPGPTYGEVFDSEKSENDVKKSITSPENNSLRVPSLPSLHPSSKQAQLDDSRASQRRSDVSRERDHLKPSSTEVPRTIGRISQSSSLAESVSAGNNIAVVSPRSDIYSSLPQSLPKSLDLEAPATNIYLRSS